MLKSYNKGINGTAKILIFYRHVSWLITSLFYLFEGTPQGYTFYKAGVITALFFLGYFVNKIYLRERSQRGTQITILVETIGLSVLLIPTGGLFSPFLWYALNPVLVSATFLSSKYSWLNLTFFLFCSLLISLEIFNPEQLTFVTLLKENANSVLAFILFNIALRLLTKAISHLNSLNAQLQDANQNVQETMSHLMTLYKVLETLSSKDNPRNMLLNIVKYSNKLVVTRAVFFSLIPFRDSDNFYFVDASEGHMNIDCKEFRQYLSENQNNIFNMNEDITEIKIKENVLLVAPIRSSSQCYGMIGFLLHDNTRSILANEQIVKFLADLSALIIERYNLDEMTSRLLISEEQNRIANEIHDSVSQRLFSIVYSTHALNAKWQSLDKDDITKQLILIKESANTAAQELRSSIYRLSSIKRGETIFFSNIRNYLNDISTLHRVNINFNATGNDELIGIDLKQTIYRIIQEACGNAIRHGKCSELSIRLNIESSYTNIKLEDNGQGFCVKETLGNLSNKGLGLRNIMNLTERNHGHCEIVSEIGNGTTINISIPLKNINQIDAGGVA